MKHNLLLINFLAAFLLFNITACGQKNLTSDIKTIPSHPRILLLKGEEAPVKQAFVADEVWNSYHVFIMGECDKLISRPPVERVLIGRRLLDKSREALRRIFYLSYAWRMTSEDKYLERAEKEMLAVSSFSDWNPSHFLDVAEMTMALAIGYDWLYDALPAGSRTIIRDAIIEKGLKPSLESQNNSWLKASHNWNQVCNAGMTYGALAVYEDQKELSQQIIDRAVGSIKLPMEDYLPDGAYPEGYGYWGYGTSFNIMFLSAMEKIYGNDFGLDINKGFFKTAGYLENMTGPSGAPFNYSDSGSGGELNPAMFWFAGRLEDASLLWSERWFLLNKKPSNDRLLPALLIWNSGMTVHEITPPLKKIWTGQGKNPVALMRTSWNDPNAIFFGLKGGSPSVNHGHMDVGSFVMEAGGIRWAMDFGPQDYNSLETAGVNLWSMVQTSQRWEVFRYNNYVHNTLIVNNKLQSVDAKAPIISFSDKVGMMNAITDITSAYKSVLNKAVRGVAIVDDQYVMIRDEVETPATETIIRWSLLTSAEVTVTGNNSAELSKDGKKLVLKVIEPAKVTMKTWSTVPTHDYDAQNPGTILVGFEATVPANSAAVLNVLMIPSGAVENSFISGKTLSEWPKTNGNQ
jgi:hypothetical protein